MGKLERVELTNMCMICDGNCVLVQERKKPNWPGVIFPGGHAEAGESFVDSVIREVKEETGLDRRQWILDRTGRIAELTASAWL